MEEIIKRRCEQLFDLGMIFNFEFNSYVGKDEKISDFNVHVTEVSLSSEDEWNTIINKFKEEIKKRQLWKVSNKINKNYYG